MKKLLIYSVLVLNFTGLISMESSSGGKRTLEGANNVNMEAPDLLLLASVALRGGGFI
jgi:hypothetical protein